MLIRCIIIPFVVVISMILFFYLKEKSKVKSKDYFINMTFVYLLSTFAYMGPIYHYDIFHETIALLKSYSFLEHIIAGFIGSFVSQMPMVIVLGSLFGIERLLKVTYNEYYVFDKLTLFLAHFFLSYFVQGFFGLIRPGSSLFLVYGKAHNISGWLGIISLLIFVTILLIGRRSHYKPQIDTQPYEQPKDSLDFF